jgi:hypothetical protein
MSGRPNYSAGTSEADEAHHNSRRRREDREGESYSETSSDEEEAMAPGTCPECSGKVSTTADACPHCGNTRFLVSTGRFISKVCGRCGGSHVLKSTDPFLLDFHKRYPDTFWPNCTLCDWRGYQLIELFEDLRDGSIHEN